MKHKIIYSSGLLLLLLAAFLIGLTTAPIHTIVPIAKPSMQLLTADTGTTLAGKIADFAKAVGNKTGDPNPTSVDWTYSPYNVAIKLTEASGGTDTTQVLVIEVHGNFNINVANPDPKNGTLPYSAYHYSAIIFILKPKGTRYVVSDYGYLHNASSLASVGKVNSESLP